MYYPNRFGRSAVAFGLALLLLATAQAAAGPASAKAEAPKLTVAQKRDATQAVKEFVKPDSAASRRAAFEEVLALGPAGAEVMGKVVDEQLAAAFKQYTQALAKKIRQAYVDRLISLTDEQVLQVQKMRRLWKDYASRGGSRHDFKKQYLKPAWDVAEFLLIKPGEIKDPNLTAPRATVVEMLDYQTKVRQAMGVEPDGDPTKGRKSPTGIDIPHLDEPPTRMFSLEFLERTVALCAMAPPGAQKVLLMNVDESAKIDVQESEFAFYTNTVRMLIGTVAWYIDPMVCAATRDHSNDRKNGDAKGHMSDLPGKRGFTDRLRRMGARWCGSEGAGGGRNGPAYAYGLSYGGGHTGPLYSLRRNVVGVGRRGGCYTSNYGTDRSLMHPCNVSMGEVFMPPGTGRSDVKSPTLQAIYNGLYTRDFARAHTLIAKAKLTSDFDHMLLRFFKAYIQAEVDWFFETIAVVEPTGDIYDVKRRTDWAMKAFAGVPGFDEKVAPIFERLGGEKPEKDLAAVYEAGKFYHIIAGKMKGGSLPAGQAKKVLNEFLKRYPDGVYAEAARACLAKETEDGLSPLVHFRERGDGTMLDKYSYDK